MPGIGFYGIGLLHILGNTTNAVTAAWREMLDNGMFANFPGFLIDKERHPAEHERLSRASWGRGVR